MNKGDRWQPHEEALLFQHADVGVLARLLPHRAKSAIYKRRERIGAVHRGPAALPKPPKQPRSVSLAPSPFYDELGPVVRLLRSGGATYREIGSFVGISIGRAHSMSSHIEVPRIARWPRPGRQPLTSPQEKAP